MLILMTKGKSNVDEENHAYEQAIAISDTGDSDNYHKQLLRCGIGVSRQRRRDRP
jgi:hypothetical protein